MTTENFLHAELGVQFTMLELHDIASALTTEAERYRIQGFKNLSKEAWILRDKVIKQIEKYNNL